MNVAALLNQQTTQIGNGRNKNSNEEQSVFGSLLESIGSKVNNSLITSQAQSNTREQLASSEEDTSIEALFSAYIAGDDASLEPLLELLNVKDKALTTITEEEATHIVDVFEQWLSIENDTDVIDKMTHLRSQLEITVLEEEPEQSNHFLMQQDTTETVTWLKNILSVITVTEKNATSNQSNEKVESIESLEQLFQSESLLELGVNQKGIEKVANLWKQVEQVVVQVVSGKFDQESNVKVLKLLEQWTALEKSAPHETANLLQDKKGTTDGQLWTRLLGTYQKRTEGQMQSKYKSNAMVTTTDVAKWVKNTVNSLSTEAKTTASTSNAETLATGQQISKLEQFVVHVKQSTQTDQKSTSDNLMEEFQKVIKSSKFMSGPNGTNQLLLKLKPNQLGDISVRLTQVNGEMMVKITATTQAAKDALETNIQQLRHMFSPNQVVIEKQDPHMFQQTTEESNRSFDDQMSQSSEEDAEGNEHNDGEQDQGSISFEEVLMNERV